ncbi:MAG: alpha/beta fold hydrolase [Hyphomicrobiales bacterium]|nr:alpha/beta fold hydrolase [Hyphomicrobiales bacterium]
MAFTENRTTIHGRSYAYRRSGGSGAPLLYLHGTDSLDHWLVILDDLAKTYDVIAPDHPGFGGTETQDGLDEVSDLAYYYLSFIEELGLRDVHVVGHSLGGWIALEMAVRSQERIADLTLLASAGINVKGHHKADIFMIDPDEQARMAFADSALGEAAAEQANADKYQDIAITDRLAAARFGWNPRFFNPALDRWLHRIKAPVLIVWGEQDRIFPPQHAPALQNLIPGSELVMLANCGHLPHIEKCEDVLAAMAAFMNR